MKINNLSTGKASLSRAPLLAAAVVSVVGTAILMPFVAIELEPSTSFMPALIAAVTVFDVMSAYLLVGDFRDRGDRRALVMAWAYIWSLVVMTGYALAFPGAIFADPPLALTASTAPYLYVAWHCGSPCFWRSPGHRGPPASHPPWPAPSACARPWPAWSLLHWSGRPQWHCSASSRRSCPL